MMAQYDASSVSGRCHRCVAHLYAIIRDPDASKDINDGDRDPMPRYNNMDENRHGTRCAGEVAAFANNTACAVGIAYRASIGGVRMLDGDVSDYIEAEALSLNPQHIDIYSASWGPDDIGMVVDGPAKLAREAFLYGILKGRSGKGSIYIWASGNGGANSDSCSCDGYTNSIFTLSVSSASEHGKKPWYLEECSSTLVTTYSSGDNYGERKIVTTDLHNRCTESHTGTSASAPLAAAMCALALEANPDLTWRDMQYVAMLSSRTEPLYDGDWVINGVGRKVSHKYGYGLLDGIKMVELAERWTTVPEQHICQSPDTVVDRIIEGKGIVRVSIDLDGCVDTDQTINYLEHVQAKVTLMYSRRGQLQLHLVSPNGTRSTLLPRRKKDMKRGQFKDWPFMSVFYWGEQPMGTWTLEIENTGSNYNSGGISYGLRALTSTDQSLSVLAVSGGSGAVFLFAVYSGYRCTLVKWQLILYGTETQPINIREPQQRRRPTKPPPEAPGSHGNKENIETSSDHDLMGSSSAVDESEFLDYNLPNNAISGQTPTVPCHVECDPSASCWGTEASDCEICRHMRLGIDGMCLAECPESTYLTEDINVCLPCPKTCHLCQGPDPDSDCLTCAPGLMYLSGQGTCLSECPSGMYPDITNTCQSCDAMCKECDLDPSKCLACVDGYELVEQHCLKICLGHQYRDPHGSCSACDSSCASCSGPGPNRCLLCRGDHAYYNNSCVTECLRGYYIELTEEGRQCRSCHPSCAACVGPGSGDCTVCTQSLKLVSGECKEDCPEGHYEREGSVCSDCHGNCLTCKGPTSGDCLTCSIGLFLEFGHCVFRCQDGYYEFVSVDEDVVMRECRQCHRSCATCEGGSQENCTTCKQGLVLSSGGRCTSHCAPFEYQGGSSQCSSCDDNCLTCAGPGPNNCTSCTPDLVLLHKHCIHQCPQGYYTHKQQCHPCHMSCADCFGPSSDMCLACKAEFVLTTEGQCVQPVEIDVVTDCGGQQYYNRHDGACHPCHKSCDTCDGPSRNHCLSCSEHHGYHPPSRQCVVCCTLSVRYECCTCSKPPGLCIEYHHHIPTEQSTVSTVITSSSSSQAGSSSTTTTTSASTTRHITRPYYIASTAYSSTTTSTSIGNSPIENNVDGNNINNNPDNLAKSRATKLWPGFVTTIVCICVFILVLFIVMFGLLQAKSSEKLCWRTRYAPVPTIYQNNHSQKVQFQNGTTKVPLGIDDFVDEEETSSA
ncbi:hypothetical protein LSH36_107g10022 [Paralvinella palmiformis]|uniref:P/Homo B domain-containing protein n=1 Tax=Paralvinella palmiformis TaxID=53620 RepID=A0AAD9N9M1_9ANNE|nr:hypothetical protein LSH36_107g10022 [Paralvinella palmiformis]